MIRRLFNRLLTWLDSLYVQPELSRDVCECCGLELDPDGFCWWCE